MGITGRPAAACYRPLLPAADDNGNFKGPACWMCCDYNSTSALLLHGPAKTTARTNEGRAKESRAKESRAKESRAKESRAKERKISTRNTHNGNGHCSALALWLGSRGLFTIQKRKQDILEGRKPKFPSFF